METEMIPPLLSKLNQLLAEGLTHPSIIDGFENITAILARGNFLIKNIACKEYYEDGDLSLVLLMKNEALANAQFEQASKFLFMEKELLAEKGDSAFTHLKTEPSFFENSEHCILFHFNKSRQNERLIANLIEGYNLVYQRNHCHKMHSN